MKQYLAIAALLLTASVTAVQAGQPVALRPTGLTLIPGLPAVIQYRLDKAAIIYITDRGGSYTYIPLRAMPQNTQSPQRLDILERKETLDYEKATKVALVNVTFDAAAGFWRVEYVDEKGVSLLTSVHPTVIAKQ